MRRRQQATISELRQAVDCLPRTTKIAMLEGIRVNEIIVGAYTDGRTGAVFGVFPPSVDSSGQRADLPMK